MNLLKLSDSLAHLGFPKTYQTASLPREISRSSEMLDALRALHGTEATRNPGFHPGCDEQALSLREFARI